MLKALGDGLCWKASSAGLSDEEAQVNEVQRLEGVRLAFEVLSWALGDRESALDFDVSFLILLWFAGQMNSC